MDDKATCACQTTSLLVFPCAGGSNVGQISNAAAVEMDRRGQGRLYCLVGVAAHLPGMVDSARSATQRVAIDGCAAACARQALEHAGVAVDQAIVVTDLGIPKNHVFEWNAQEVEQVIRAVEIHFTTPQNVSETESSGCCGGSCSCN